MQDIKWILTLFTAALAGCQSIAIEGTYVDGAGFAHSIDSDQWVIDAGDYGVSVFRIADFDNGDGVAIAMNDEDNDFAPGLWSRFEWLDGDPLYYCQVVFDGEDQEAAEEGGPADASDPAKSGCGGEFPWSTLTPE